MKLTKKQKKLNEDFFMTEVFLKTSKSRKEKMYFQNKLKEIDNDLMIEEIKKFKKTN